MIVNGEAFTILSFTVFLLRTFSYMHTNTHAPVKCNEVGYTWRQHIHRTYSNWLKIELSVYARIEGNDAKIAFTQMPMRACVLYSAHCVYTHICLSACVCEYLLREKDIFFHCYSVKVQAIFVK